LAPRSWLRLPRRTVRLRLTALYGALFLVSGAVLLAITYGLVVSRPQVTAFHVVSIGGGVVKAVPGQAAGVARACQAFHLSCPTKVFPNGALSATPGSASAGNSVAGSGAAGGVAGGPGFLSRFPSGPAQIVATLPTPGERHALLIVSAIALGIMALIAIGLGWLMAGRVLRPLRTMTATARQISEVNLHERLEVRGPDDELKDLGDTIDGLLGRLETAFEAQRRFVANASHELRTPLAMMRTSVDVALGKPQAPPEVKVLASKLGEGLNQADRLLEGLLVLARAQRASLGEITEVSLPALVFAALVAEQDEISARHLTILDGTVGCEVLGNETLLARLVANVVNNAVRHNIDHGMVVITNGMRQGMASLVVDSGGPVLDEQAVQELAQPFHRLGPDRIADNNGAGLGLSIVRAIAAAHGGSLRLRARPEGGLRVVIELPMAVGV
jgi:signal transduction histidine kinase